MSQPELNVRSRRILFAVVTEFIATGDPVGSRTLARRYGLELSAASIRNVLSDLEESGFLAQPHTSAGRIPTDKALRLFINALVEFRDLSPSDHKQMTMRLREIYDGAGDPLRETGKYLSELSGSAAVIAESRTVYRTLQQLRFMTVRKDQLLAVLVFDDGTVENRFVPNDEKIDENELLRVHNLLADVIEGRSLAEVRELFARRLADDRLAVDALRRRAFALANYAVKEVESKSQVVIEGHAKLLDLKEYEDVNRLKNLVRVLEERSDLVELLDKTIEASGVTVFVGSETELGSGGLSLVVAPYGEQGGKAGAVGVLGPTRMDYAKVMPLVDATAAAITHAVRRRTADDDAEDDL